MNLDVIDADGGIRLQMQRIFATDDERALICGGNGPRCRARGAQAEVRTLVRLKSPRTADCPRYLAIETQAFDGVCVDEKTATGRVGLRGKFDVFAVFSRNV